MDCAAWMFVKKFNYNDFILLKQESEMENKLDRLSMNIEQSKRDKLQAIFPQCFVEGRH